MHPETYPTHKPGPIYDQPINTGPDNTVPKFHLLPSVDMSKPVFINTLNPNGYSLSNKETGSGSLPPENEIQPVISLSELKQVQKNMGDNLYKASDFYYPKAGPGKEYSNFIKGSAEHGFTGPHGSSKSDLLVVDNWLKDLHELEEIEEDFGHNPQTDPGILATSAPSLQPENTLAPEQGKYKKLVAAAKDAGKILLDEVMKTAKGIPAIYEDTSFKPLNWHPTPEMLNWNPSEMPHKLHSATGSGYDSAGPIPASAFHLHETQAKTEELVKPEIDGIQRFKKDAPKFEDQILDTSRTNRFSHLPSIMANSMSLGEEENPNIRELTEHEGLVGLRDFLMECATNPQIVNDLNNRYYAEAAESILETLTFIGKKEYDEAVQGIGQLWKDYLESDPENQLCVPLNITRSEGIRKSDSYLFDSVLATFSDEELEQYSGRIVEEVADITKEPEHVRIILLDDWTISGSQMGTSFSRVRDSDTHNKYAACVRVNLITASAERLEHGLAVGESWNNNATMLPVEAYFRAHTAKKSSHGTHVTGTHSSVDYDFQTTISSMRTVLSNLDTLPEGTPVEQIKMPPLTNIVRAYRTSRPTVVFDDDGRIRKNKE